MILPFTCRHESYLTNTSQDFLMWPVLYIVPGTQETKPPRVHLLTLTRNSQSMPTIYYFLFRIFWILPSGNVFFKFCKQTVLNLVEYLHDMLILLILQLSPIRAPKKYPFKSTKRMHLRVNMPSRKGNPSSNASALCIIVWLGDDATLY